MVHMKFWVVTALLTAGSASLFASVDVVEEIVAKVNGDIITRGDLADARREAQEQFARQGLKGMELQQATGEIEKNALRNKIDQLLLVQKGKELDLKVDSDVSKYLADLQKQVGEPDPDKFHDKIRQETGMSFEDFKADVTNNMLTERVIRQEVMRQDARRPQRGGSLLQRAQNGIRARRAGIPARDSGFHRRP